MTQYAWYEVKYNADGNVVSAEKASDAKASWTKTAYVDEVVTNSNPTLINAIRSSAYDVVLYEGKTLTKAPSLKGSTLFFDGMTDTGIVVADDVKYVYTQTVDNKETTTCESGFGSLKTALDELNTTISYKCSAVIENGIATVVTVYDATKAGYTPVNPSKGDYTFKAVNASVETNGQIKVAVTLPDEVSGWKMYGVNTVEYTVTTGSKVFTFTRTVGTKDAETALSVPDYTLPGLTVKNGSDISVSVKFAFNGINNDSYTITGEGYIL